MKIFAIILLILSVSSVHALAGSGDAVESHSMDPVVIVGSHMEVEEPALADRVVQFVEAVKEGKMGAWIRQGSPRVVAVPVLPTQYLGTGEHPYNHRLVAIYQ